MFPAHSKTDPATGELVFFDYALYEPKMSTGIISAEGALTHFQEIELPGPRLPHDMGMTENYVILHDLPVVFTDQGIKNRLWQIHVADLPDAFWRHAAPWRRNKMVRVPDLLCLSRHQRLGGGRRGRDGGLQDGSQRV